MKIREIRLQNGIFVYKVGISFTKWDFHLQRGTLALQTGLSFYISPMEDVIYETQVENAYIVPCMNLLENPSALLEDARFAELLDKLAETYRYVIIDSPPLGSVADAAQIASLCDGAALVVRAGETSRSLIKQSFQQLDQVGCTLLGVILNRAQTTGRAYKKYYGKYGKYYSQYGYGYGTYGKEAAASSDSAPSK